MTRGAGGAVGGVRRTFASLGVRNFRLFIAGQLVSATGFWMQSVAAPLLVLRLTNSGTALGIDTALQFLPILLFGAWGGVVADRFDNRKVQIATQIAYAVLALALGVLVAAGAVEVWMVYLLSFLSGLVTAVDMPTRQSFYLEMVGPATLTNAMSLNTATFTGSRIVGSAIAGAVIGAFGFSPVFLANAASYLAILAALLAMRVDELHPRERAPREPGQVREAIRYVWRTPELRVPMLTMLVVFLFAFNFIVFLPLLVTRDLEGNAEALGAVLALWGAGSLGGALAMASRSSQPNARRLAVLAIALGVVSALLAIAPTLAVAAIVVVPLGAVFIAFAITGNSILQLTSAGRMRGRVMALYTVAFLGSTPIGGPIAGWVGEHVGAPFGLAAGGAIAVAAGALALAAVRDSAGRGPGVARPETPRA
jgi:predicted MFS family arabinose efflux permease